MYIINKYKFYTKMELYTISAPEYRQDDNSRE